MKSSSQPKIASWMKKQIDWADKDKAYWENVLQQLPLEHDKPDITPRETEALYLIEAVAYRCLRKHEKAHTPQAPRTGEREMSTCVLALLVLMCWANLRSMRKSK